MSWTRRNFLWAAGLGTAASAIATPHSPAQPSPSAPTNPIHEPISDLSIEPIALGRSQDWDAVRARFELDPNYIHLAGLLLTSHPAPVQAAIDTYQAGLNDNPAHYLKSQRQPLDIEVRQQAAAYLGTQPHTIALTDSTTMGTGLVINGLVIRPDQEMLTTTYDYYSTHASLSYKAARSGATVRKIPLYQDIHTVSRDEMVDTLITAIRPHTRLITATWVHSSTGLKVPIARIAERLAIINETRSEADRVLFFVDGVHGLGVENVDIPELDCDFFVAGTHKWIFGPRGSGLIWGNPRSHGAVLPTIPSFTWWDRSWGGRMTPGGFKPYEHQWAVAQAFALHQQMGKKRVAKRLRRLSRQLKKGLAKMPHVTLYTPIDKDLSAAIVCFDVEGLRPWQVVRKLRDKNVIASTTPYSPSYARLTPGVYNTSAEMELVLQYIRELA